MGWARQGATRQPGRARLRGARVVAVCCVLRATNHVLRATCYVLCDVVSFNMTSHTLVVFAMFVAS
jgi:hypothetical protein